jgi:hypothetical protein
VNVIAKEGISLEQEVKEYDQIFSKIAKKRIGIDGTMIDKINNPFIVQTIEHNTSDITDPVQTPEYSLEAIVNQRVKINGQWYGIHETIETYKIVKITQKSATLANEIETKELFIRTKNGNNVEILSK